MPNQIDNWALNLIFGRAVDCALAAELLAAEFDELGALGTQEKKLGDSGETALCVFLPPTVARGRAMKRTRDFARKLHRAGVLPRLPRFSTAAVETHDWVAEFRRHFRGIRVSPTLRVVPPWRAHPPSQPLPRGRLELIIEPGMAFGTGTHETTRLCLRLLEDQIRRGARVADLGAGSGILSIAAALLGARAVLAVESDADAHENFDLNVRLNRVTRRVRLVKSGVIEFADGLARRGNFDLIVCNILFEKMRPLLPHFRRLARRDGTTKVIVSGYLWSERHEALRELEHAGICPHVKRRMREWGAIAGRISD